MTDIRAGTSEFPKATKSKIAKEAPTDRKRPVRVTRDMLVKKGPLIVPESVRKPGMVHYWMKDGPYQFEKYNRLGYEFTIDNDGKKVSVGRTGEILYLLEISKDLHEDIQAMKKEIKSEHTDDIRGISNPRQEAHAEGIFEDRLVVK